MVRSARFFEPRLVLVLVLVVVLVASLLRPASARAARQEAPAGSGELCGACKTTGRGVNPWFESRGEAEAASRCCSTFFEGDKAALGAPFLPCARCKRADLKGAAERELAAIRSERERWLAGQRAIDAQLGTRLFWVESDHFVVGFEPARYRLRDKREIDGHAAAHLFARRLEGMYADFEQLFGIDDARMRNRRHQVLIFEQLKHMSKAAEVLLSMSSDTAAKLAGDPSILVTWLDRANLPGDLEMDRHVTHHVTHLLVSVFHLKEWLYAQGFLDEGIAHFFETRYFRLSENSCNQEEREEDLGGKSWPREVLLAVQAGRNPSLAELCAKRTDQLEGSDHFFAWSLADWLIETDPAKVASLMAKLKEKVELREALRELYGRNLFELERDWKAWVVENYPARAKPLPAGATVELAADALRGFPDRPVTSARSARAPGSPSSAGDRR